MPLRDQRCARFGETSAMTRTPSHFGSIVQPSSGGSSPAGEASIGAGTRGTSGHRALLEVEIEPHPPFGDTVVGDGGGVDGEAIERVSLAGVLGLDPFEERVARAAAHADLAGRCEREARSPL